MKKNTIRKELLLWLLKAGGLIVLSILAPQLPSALLTAYFRERKRIKERLKRLENRGYIKISEDGDKIKIELVEKGIQKAQYFQLENLKIDKPEQWDGLWRVIVFDIPEEKKFVRDILRWKLKKLGFIRLQKSVFILPYDCKKEFEILSSTYKIKPYLTFMIVKELSNEKQLIDKFNLINYQ